MSLLKEAADGYRTQYAELWDTWKALDTKAQGVCVVSGVFVAAVFAFTRDAGHVPTSCRYIALLLLLALAVTLTLAIHAAMVRVTTHAPVERIRQITKDLLKAEPKPDSTSIDDYYSSVISEWETSVINLNALITNKGNSLKRAQLSLGVTGMIALSLAAAYILSKGGL